MGFASINGIVLHYRLSGAPDGAPLVLVNSLGTSCEIWDDVLPLLAPHCRMLTYDKRGHGLSDAPPGPYSLDDHIADLLGLATHCGFERFDLCGISIGGMIGIRVAARHPDRVRRVVLCDTAPAIGTDDSWNDRIAHVEREGMAEIAETILLRWVTDGYPAARPAEFAGWLNMLARCPADGYAASCASVRDADLGGEPEAISVPTLVVVGEADVSTPPDAAKKLADSIPGARLEPIRGAGHVPAIEQAAALAGLIRDHLHEGVHV